MGYQEIADALKFPAGASDRYKSLDALDRLLDNSFFDDIPQPFEQETDADGQYLPLTKRRPSVKFNLARIVIDESSGSLWTDDEMAKVVCGINDSDQSPTGEDKKNQRNVDQIMTQCAIDAVMMEAYEKSASGSGAIILDYDDDGMPTFECLQGKYLRPTWTARNGGTLKTLEYVYPTTAKDLRAIGKVLDKDIGPAEPYWVRIVYTAEAELHYAPMRATDYERLGTEDPDTKKIVAWKASQAFPHDWEIVPAVYLKSLLFGETASDGRCPYSDVADMQVEIARILSQVGRGFRFAADPLLVRQRGDMQSAVAGMKGAVIDPLGDDQSFEKRGRNGETIRSASNVIEGEAKLLEITGNGLKEAVAYAKVLREWALEVAGAMKADAETTKGAMSGRALDLLQQMMRLLVKRQRIAYGQRGMIPLLRVILAGCMTGVLSVPDVVDADPKARMFCEWPKRDNDAEMAEDQKQAEIDEIRLRSGVIVPNEVRERDNLGSPLPLGSQQYIPGHGPYTGASTLGNKPDDEGDPNFDQRPGPQDEKKTVTPAA